MQNLNLRNQIFTVTSKDNILTFFFSYLAYPISIFLNKIKVSPNTVTFCSLICSFIACYFFVFEKFILFIVFWLICSLLDFCDGQIARMSGNINKTAFNFDGFSDLLKITSVIIASAIYYDNKLYWIFCTLLVFCFPFFSILNTSYSNLKYKKKKQILSHSFTKNIFFRKLLNNFISIFFKVGGHTLFLFPILAINEYLAFSLILYLLVLLLLNVSRFSYLLIMTKI